ncbi:MAG: CDP-alcohol phosphatidyltransferase family protein [Anaerolineae bacterium]|nr:MAG: CDP-alcohol phosphatidyltransferase family protein [Anaerolineae bacterium]
MSELIDKTEKPQTFTDWMRVTFKDVLDPIGAFLNRLGLMPNTLTLIGVLGNALGAFFLMRGQMLVGGVIILLMGPIDALDGTMARLRGEPSAFGAFVDSVSDRYSELVIYLGLLLYYLQRGDWLLAGLVYLAAAGSVLVSYVRARGEALGYEAKVGLLTRLERYIVLAPSLVFNIPHIGVGIIAVLANVTALQRIVYVRRQAHAQMKAKERGRSEA